MFVRTKKTSSNKFAIQIVENNRVDGKTKQKVVKHVGTAADKNDADQLKQIAITIAKELTSHRLCSKPEKDYVGRYGSIIGKLKKAPEKQTVLLSGLLEDSRLILGIHDIYGYIYDLLDFTNPFSQSSRRKHAAKTLNEVVIARIANPCSKRATVAMLEKDFGTSIKLDHVYQMMDKIDDAFCNRIQERASAATLRLTDEKLKVLFYDATTLYFESFTEDDLKQNGYSKDMKFNQPQVLLALFVTRDGLPVGYELFPGATYEGHTLKPVLEKLKSRYQIDEMIFVADRGMLSKDNLDYLEQNNIPYIVGARLRSLNKRAQQKVLSWKHHDELDTVNMDLDGKKNLILSYSEKRAKKDRYDREESIQKLYKKLSKSRNPKNVISNYGYQKYLQIDGNAILKINEDKLAQESVWDGISGIYTNQTNISNEEALAHYRSLWQIEESFRIQKHDLRIRPIYHWSPKRVKAHIAISFMAFACIRHLEYRVKMQYKKLSPEAIRKALLHVQASIIEDKRSHKKYLLPSKIDQEAKQIYRVVGIKPPNQIQAIL